MDLFLLEDSNHRLRFSASEAESWQDILLAGNEDASPPEEKRGRRFFLILYILVIAAFLGLLGRAWSLQVIQGKNNRRLAEGNRIREIPIRAPRGTVFDRNGKALTANVADFEVVVTPGDLPKDEDARAALYKTLGELLALPVPEVQKKAEAKGLDSYQLVPLTRNVPREKALELETKLKELSGVSVQINPIREYNEGTLFAHLLGYIGRITEADIATHPDYLLTDYIGKDGIEKEYESVLRGTHGAKIAEVDALGKVARTIDPPREAVPGNNLVLSLDAELQKKAFEALQRGLSAARAKKGSVVAVEPKTGRVLAAASAPSFDNSALVRGLSEEAYAGLLNNPDNPLFFKAVLGTYPSGSTIKPYVAAAALSEHTITPGTTVNSTGGIRIGEFSFPDWKAGGHGVTDVRKAIAESVNTFFYAIGGGYQNIRGLGIKKIDDWLVRFGFGDPTGIDLPDEASGLVPTPAWKQAQRPADCPPHATSADDCWYLGDTYHLAIGQGDIQVTPLQVAMAASAVANGGTLFEPRVALNVADANGRVLREIAPKAKRANVAPPAVLGVVREGMRQAVTAGSARALNSLPVHAAGKTGTAEFGPNNSKKHAWMTAFAPYEDPQIVLVVLLEGGGEGSTYATPVAQEILQWYFTTARNT